MTPMTYLAIGFAAVMFGIDKSLASGAGLLSVATLTAVMPAHQASGLTLLMAICADWSAIWAYRGNVSVKSLVRLIPFVVVGICGGIVFLYIADNTAMRRTIGIILAVFVGMYFLNLIRKRLAGNEETTPARASDEGNGISDAERGGKAAVFSWLKRIVCGILAGLPPWSPTPRAR